ncbi:NUDIX domain-containing protein [uncultured Nocardioides sp.]|uniref:NUDIX domain-containing protein n=1 Tax=uncultured Nocardioides sp. TaxID=198441 RepID=UPI0026031311|nr:NUDIX domain-containing protein [uncultured Nocardioides sp.]
MTGEVGEVGEVVGAAVVRHGLLLAARRTRPAAAAGRWELPGGKVEPGETPDAALVREVAEELGCAVVVRRWLPGSTDITTPSGARLRLRVAVCDVADGEPTPGEHDRLAWLGPEQLGDVDWLEPDRPFLPLLREHLAG